MIELFNPVFWATNSQDDDLYKLKVLQGKIGILSDSGNSSLVKVLSFHKKDRYVSCRLELTWNKVYHARTGKFSVSEGAEGKVEEVGTNLRFGTCAVTLQADAAEQNYYLSFSSGYGTSRLFFMPALIGMFLEEDAGWFESLAVDYQY